MCSGVTLGWKAYGVNKYLNFVGIFSETNGDGFCILQILGNANIQPRPNLALYTVAVSYCVLTLRGASEAFGRRCLLRTSCLKWQKVFGPGILQMVHNLALEPLKKYAVERLRDDFFGHRHVAETCAKNSGVLNAIIMESWELLIGWR